MGTLHTALRIALRDSGGTKHAFTQHYAKIFGMLSYAFEGYVTYHGAPRIFGDKLTLATAVTLAVVAMDENGKRIVLSYGLADIGFGPSEGK